MKTKKAKKLDIEKTIFERDENKTLIPQKRIIDVEGKEYEIKVIPLLRGELRNILLSATPSGETTKDQDAEIVAKACVEPNYTVEKAKDLKPQFCKPIVNAILEASGVPIKGKSFKKAFENKEGSEKKN